MRDHASFAFADRPAHIAEAVRGAAENRARLLRNKGIQFVSKTVLTTAPSLLALYSLASLANACSEDG
jgi:hypothetical protein